MINTKSLPYLISMNSDLKDYRENYDSSAYKVIEYEKRNTPVKKTYSLEPLKPNEVLI